MFYLASKILGFFVLPSNALVAAALLGAALTFTRFAKAGRRLALVALLLVLLCGLGPVGSLAIAVLEERFPPPPEGQAPDGIVLLGGGVEDRLSAMRGRLELNEAGDRVLALVALARRYPEARIVVSGGASALFSSADRPEAEMVGGALAGLGLDPVRLTLEGASRTTAENARFTARLVAPRPGETWWLVTSAFHMPRAIGAFRAAGFPVVAYPIDHRTGGIADALRPFSSVSEGLRRTDVAAREWIGLLAYRASGRTSALFPEP
jgi:uncharacterized SAM-binding protein YcdF (DUF218 family)